MRAHSKGHVMVVDDTPDTIQMIRTSLEGQGYIVSVASQSESSRFDTARYPDARHGWV
jgi:CheY-like chemotaxis protein